ncbi:hypothetical protein APICC_00376 [Apis cerana cerana]|uniref:Uncharacterized protein n=1 Tax=Apis cerana cerana TaxID=94128 RepID=A0A2A3EBC5_APICC|nr:hypothetical protein APICC_00376 [Apis cerana cerana]
MDMDMKKSKQTLSSISQHHKPTYQHNLLEFIRVPTLNVQEPKVMRNLDRVDSPENSEGFQSSSESSNLYGLGRFCKSTLGFEYRGSCQLLHSISGVHPLEYSVNIFVGVLEDRFQRLKKHKNGCIDEMMVEP